MDLVQFILEIYVGNCIANKQQLFMPSIMAIQQAIQVCVEASQSEEPIRVVFTNNENEKIEYKNNAFIKFEGG